MFVEKKVSGHLGVIFINNPPFNALSSDVFRELRTAFEELQKNDAVKTIVITGNGIAFSAGADVKDIFQLIKTGAREELRKLIEEIHAFFLDIDNSPKPTVAAVNGFCLGGGLELALACDYILAVPNAQFGFPEVGLGIIPGLGGTQRLTRKIGVRDAVRLVASARLISADKASEVGLVDRVLAGDFIGGVKDFVREVLSGAVRAREGFVLDPTEADMPHAEFEELAKDKPMLAAITARSAIRHGAALPLGEGFAVELEYFLVTAFTPDAQEGLGAFIEKRSPSFLAVLGATPNTRKEPTPQKETVICHADAPPWEKEEYVMFREMVRNFARNEITPRVKEMEENECIPKELIRQMGDLGMFGVSFPEEYGGSGLGKLGACILADELTYVHPSTAVFFGAHVSLFCEAMYLFGTEDQKTRYLVPALKGELVGALATTESGVGSDVGSMKTRARKVDDGWLLKGSKQFITNAEIADYIIVFAQTDPLGGNKTLIALVVDTRSKGFEITKREKKIGIHASNTNGFSLDDVFVPDANVLGEPGRGFKMVMKVFNHSRVTLSAGCVGFMRRALDEAISFAKNRTLFGEPMLLKQNTQLKLAEMDASRFMVEAMVYQGAWMIDRGLDVRNEAAMIKYWGPELAHKVVDMSVQLHGGAGFIEDSPIAMFYRDVRIFRLFEGTSEIQLLTRAKEMVKEHFR